LAAAQPLNRENNRAMSQAELRKYDTEYLMFNSQLSETIIISESTTNSTAKMYQCWKPLFKADISVGLDMY